jgi:hypothetical protein
MLLFWNKVQDDLTKDLEGFIQEQGLLSGNEEK